MKKILFIAAFSVTIFGCADKKTEQNVEDLLVETTEVTADPNNILAKEWQLKELNGNHIVLDSTFNKYPFIKFNDLKTATGNLGCNGFGAKVAFTGSNSIKISEITSTEMACGNLDIETKFNEALQNTTNYIVSGTTLFFNNNENVTLITLEVKAE